MIAEMPIRPENKARYPKNWPEISARIRARAGNKCEDCGVPLYPNSKGDAVHAEMPSDVEPEASHFH